jgi:rod shape-determining protein MreD
METGIFKYIIRFAVLIAIQVLILNHIQLSGYINPFMYVMFILLLPFDTKGWVLLVSAFALGLSIDMFSNSLGMHASACVFMAFFRPSVIRLISTRTEYETATAPLISNMGAGWIFLYSLILVFIHHLALFMIEVFRLDEIFHTITRTLLSTSVSVLIIMLAYFLISKPQRAGSLFK